MKSYEVIKQALDEPGVKAAAARLKVSPALVYKWCEAPAAQEDPEQSGAKNPLDRVRDLHKLTGDIRLIRWLCNQAGGFFVKNPGRDEGKCLTQSIFGETHGMVRDFSNLLAEVTRSFDDDGVIDAEEADQIRQRWEDLKACVERFVKGCEDGVYHGKKT